MDPHPTVELLRLLEDQNTPDHACRLLEAVREAWDAVARDRDESEAIALAIIELLQDVDHIRLARMVLPALRRSAELPDHHLQRQIVQRTADVRTRLDDTSRTQRSFDHPHYRQEKEMLQEAEMHRLRLLLFGNDVLNDREVQQIRTWLDDCPLAPCDGPEPPMDLPQSVAGPEERALRETDVHVLRLLLFSSEILTQQQREAVLAWLDSCPLQVRRDSVLPAVDRRLDRDQRPA